MRRVVPVQNDPEEERRVIEEQRKAQEAAARTARLEAKAAKARRCTPTPPPPPQPQSPPCLLGLSMLLSVTGWIILCNLSPGKAFVLESNFARQSAK